MTYRASSIWDTVDLRWLLNLCIVRDRFCQMLNLFRSTASAKPDFSLACWITNTPRTSSLLAVGLASESTCALSIQQERKLKPGKLANWSPAVRISCAVTGTSRKKLNSRSETASSERATLGIRTQTDTSTFLIA